MSKEKNIIKNSRFLRVLFARKSVVVCTVIIVAMVLLSVFADYTAPYGYNDQDYYHVMTDPSAQNILGTDNLGRDILSRLIYGGRISFAVNGELESVDQSIFLRVFENYMNDKSNQPAQED